MRTKGTGIALTYTLICELPGAEKLNRKEIAELVDIALMNCDSGSFQRKR
ncbi:hypothetical protein ACG1BZ_09420 [Microbulbifer sp. CNSA002]